MINAQYTPGPWNIEGEAKYDDTGHYIGGLSIAGDNNNIAIITPWQAPLEAQENARLIAAAPEMLVALQEVLNSLTYAADALRVPPDSQFTYTIHQVRAAITKATGEE